MPDINDVVKLGIDAYHGNVEKYSVSEANDVLRQALIEANNGSTVLNYKNIRDGKCVGLFSIIEEILSHTVVEGLQENDYFFQNLVEFRNLALGDQNLFITYDDTAFVVADVAEGTQGIRRQRLTGSSEFSVPTQLKAVRIYEELNRILAGRVDFNDMIRKVADAFRQQLLNDTYGLWAAATSDDFGGTTYFPAAGTYDEDALLELIAHTEAAANGTSATILCTKKAARKLAPSIQSIDANNDMYHNGYYGSFYGTPVVLMPQRHKIGTTEFLFPDNQLTIVAGQDRPIKVVYEGDSTIIMDTPTTNGDLTQNYLYMERYGVSLLMAGGNAGIGRYEFSE